MQSNEYSELERRIKSGACDDAISNILAESLSGDDNNDIALNSDEQASLNKILERGNRTAKSRLWLLDTFPVTRLLEGQSRGEGETAFTLSGPPTIQPDGTFGTKRTARGVISFGERQRLRLSDEIEGNPLTLLLVTPTKASRQPYNELLGFHRVNLPRDDTSRVVSSEYAIALRSNLSSEPSNVHQGTYTVIVEMENSQLRILTPRMDQEDETVLTMVEFDDHPPRPVVLMQPSEGADFFEGTCPLPVYLKSGDDVEANVILRDLLLEELPLLSAAEASLWLAGQHSTPIAITTNESGCTFTLPDRNRRFIEANPDAHALLRIAPF